jgi:outer membrane protein assembly factor BamB
VSFSANNLPPGFTSPGQNSYANVVVATGASGTPITNATVAVDGVALTYVGANGDYEAPLSVSPGQTVSLSVTVAGAVYSSSSSQFASYPSVTSPANGTTWLTSATNQMSWTGPAPSGSQYGIAILDANGAQVWPVQGTGFQSVPAGTNSFAVPAGSLGAGNHFAICGLGKPVSIEGAASGSLFAIGGFGMTSFAAAVTMPATLVSIAVTSPNPEIGPGGNMQLTATATYSDATTADITSSAQWGSNAASVVSVNSAGLATGGAPGAATVSATVGTVTGFETLPVFQPTSSNTPPLNQTVTYQGDPTHSGFATFGTTLSLGSPAWTLTLPGFSYSAGVSYPIVAGGHVFVTAGDLGASGLHELFAFNEADGSQAWPPIALGSGLPRSALAYDSARLFVITYAGELRAVDAATGATLWTTQLLPDSANGNSFNRFLDPPVAANGVVYVVGATTLRSGSILYAVDESNGNTIWSVSVPGQTQFSFGGNSPLVLAGGVYIGMQCDVASFGEYSGTAQWTTTGPGPGCNGYGATPVLGNGRLYVNASFGGNAQNQIYDPVTGAALGTYGATQMPAFTATTGFFLDASSGTPVLNAVSLSSGATIWSATGNGGLSFPPFVIDNMVIAVSGAGYVYAYDTATGAQLGYGTTGWFTPLNIGSAVPQPGVGAGEGYLVIPGPNTLTAWRLSP